MKWLTDAVGCLQSVHFDAALSATFLWFSALHVDRYENKRKCVENKKLKHKRINRDSICLVNDHFLVNI